VVVQLGDELVTDMEQALLELAKNAYDADSISCEIVVEPHWCPAPEDPAAPLLNAIPAEHVSEDGQQAPPGRIRIIDKGTGISASDVEHGWLKISASVKRPAPGRVKATTVKQGRTPVGDKGLGRLATMKIGSVLRMKTAVDGEDRWRTVTFSWRDFTPTRTLEEVPVLPGLDTEEPVEHSGTIIEILGLHDHKRWLDPTLIETELVPNLSALVSPFPRDDEFTISVKVGAVEHRLEHLDEAVLNLAAAKFEYEWDGARLVQRAFIAPTLFRGDRGEDAAKAFRELMQPATKAALLDFLASNKKLKERGFSTDVSAPWLFKFEDELPGVPLPLNKQFPGATDPGPFSGTLYYFLFHEDVKKKLAVAGTGAATLQAMSQVAIFRDGFRVRAQKDWLRLHEAATSGSSYYTLRPANVVGYFDISNAKNPKLIEKSDREGFVDSPAYRGFMTLGLRTRDYANAILEATRVAVRNFQAGKSPVDAEKPRTREQLVISLDTTQARASSALEKMQAELASARAVLLEASDAQPGDRALLKGQLERASEALLDAGRQLEQQASVSRLIADLGEEEADFSSRLLDAAAVGLAARSLSHELHSYVRQLRDGLALIANENRQLRNPTLRKALSQLTGVTREFAKTVATIDPLLPGSRTLKENINVDGFLQEFVDARTAAAKRNGVTLLIKTLEQGRGLTVRFSRTRLLQIVENLFQNSLYWLKQGPLPEKERREIGIEVTPQGFVWSDSGPGIRPSLESSIFDAYVSDKPRAESSGLGLHIVTTFLELERSTIRLTPERNRLGRRFQFEIDLTGAAVQRSALV
jgi:signal transduction histidine kinase